MLVGIPPLVRMSLPMVEVRVKVGLLKAVVVVVVVKQVQALLLSLLLVVMEVHRALL